MNYDPTKILNLMNPKLSSFSTVKTFLCAFPEHAGSSIIWVYLKSSGANTVNQYLKTRLIILSTVPSFCISICQNKDFLLSIPFRPVENRQFRSAGRFLPGKVAERSHY